jgi:hypothetical protein
MRPAVPERLRAYADRLVASDPGLNRLITALSVVLGVGVTLAVEYGFEQLTHAMWTAPAAQHHAITLLAMLVGGIVAMMAAVGVSDPRPRDQAITLGLLPVPLLASLALAIELSGDRPVSLVGLSLVMGLGTYLRRFAPRFGPRAFLYGVMLFMGYFFGLLAGAEIPLGDLGSLALLLWVAVAVNLALKLVLGATINRGAVARTERAFIARARRVAGAAARLLAAGDGREAERAARQLRGRLVRCNEAALMIDGQLITETMAPPPPIAWSLHRRLFEVELAVTAIARLTGRLRGALDAETRHELSSMLLALRLGHDDEAESTGRSLQERVTGATSLDAGPEVAARISALAGAVIDTASALRGDLAAIDAGAPDAPFRSPVQLFAGNLSGSTRVTNDLAAERSQAGSLRGRLELDAPARTALRIMVAVGAACAAGSALSERRFYWAVIAVFIAFMGANTSGEQIIKAANRVLGTVVGILLGSLLAGAIGPTTWSLAIILPALGIGVYFLRVSYSLMVVGITILVSLLYVQLGEYSTSLLTLRLEETAIGAAIAMLAAVLVFPIGTGQATRFAVGRCLEALRELLDHVAVDPAQPRQEDWAGPSGDQRALDDALQQLLTTVRPLYRDPFLPRRDIEHAIGLIATLADYTRLLVAGGSGHPGRSPLPDALRERVRRALDVQREWLQTTITAAEAPLGAPRGSGASPTAYPSIADDLAAVDAALAGEGVAPEAPVRRHLRALVRLDETLGELSGRIGVILQSHPHRPGWRGVRRPRADTERPDLGAPLPGAASR